MSAVTAPLVLVVAGPNGAGKSTAAEGIMRQVPSLTNYINPDVIARGLNPLAPETVSFAAGRIVLTRIRELAARREDFAFETTLSGLTYAPLLRKMKADGYEVRITFLYVESPELSIARVAERVKAGGHHIPTSDIMRRHGAALRNFFGTFRYLCDAFEFYDNSGEYEPRLLAELQSGQLKIYNRDVWIELEDKYA